MKTKIKVINFRVPSDVKDQFQAVSARFGGMSDVLLRLVNEFIDEEKAKHANISQSSLSLQSERKYNG